MKLRNQLDRHAIQDILTIEGLLSFGQDGKFHFRQDYYNHPESKLLQERYLEILSSDGSLLFRNERLGRQVLGGPPFLGEGENGYSERRTRLADGTRILLLSRRHITDGRSILIRLAYSEEQVWLPFEELVSALLFILPLAITFAGLIGYAIARQILAPLEHMTQQAEQITPEQLHHRLFVENTDDELGHLARVVNTTLDRLQQSFEQMKRFTSDASHELRTPLTAIRSVGEVGLQKDGSREEYRDIIGSMLEEVNRLTRLVESLLTISRGDAAQGMIQSAPLCIRQLIQESASLLEVLMEEKQQLLVLEGEQDLVMEGDRLLLRQAVVNLLHNAVKFSPVAGTITIQILSTENDIFINVADKGPGIASEHRDKVFNRFYRVDAGRSRDTGGVGLGLSIAGWAVHAHGGEISLDSNVGYGSVFRVRLPKTTFNRVIQDRDTVYWH